MTIKDEKYRMAFMYQLLICGRISEVCGKYAPTGTDAIETMFTVERKKKVEWDGRTVTIMEETEEPFVLFVVKTAKRKGKLRPCAVPLNPEYEPWAQPLLDYFKKAGDDYPFMFNPDVGHSVRYAQWKAQQTFAEMMWPMAEYTKTVEIPYTEDMRIGQRQGDTGYDQYLVEMGGERYWTYDTSVVKKSEKVLDRWKPLRSHALRKRRTNTLKWDYGFDEFDLAAYGGWTETSRVDAMPAAMKFYLHMDIQSSEEGIKILKQMANSYVTKLCKVIA
jgi:hypothetical protein